MKDTLRKNAIEILKDHYDEYPSERTLKVIAELEALQHRSCEGCKYVGGEAKQSFCVLKLMPPHMYEFEFCCNRYEPKDKLIDETLDLGEIIVKQRKSIVELAEAIKPKSCEECINKNRYDYFNDTYCSSCIRENKKRQDNFAK